jgi:hypothetical protein
MTLCECPVRYAKLRLHDILYGEVSILNGNKPSEKSSEGRELINTHLLHKYIPLDLWDGKWAFFDDDSRLTIKTLIKSNPLTKILVLSYGISLSVQRIGILCYSTMTNGLYY